MHAFVTHEDANYLHIRFIVKQQKLEYLTINRLLCLAVVALYCCPIQRQSDEKCGL